MEEVDQAKQETVNAQKREEQAKIELTSKQSTIVSLQVRIKESNIIMIRNLSFFTRSRIRWPQNFGDFLKS